MATPKRSTTRRAPEFRRFLRAATAPALDKEQVAAERLELKALGFAAQYRGLLCEVGLLAEHHTLAGDLAIVALLGGIVAAPDTARGVIAATLTGDAVRALLRLHRKRTDGAST